MEIKPQKVHLRWSDLDPNFHLRHTIYYDLAAQMRTALFVQEGISPAYMMENHFGPVLFREECLFHREVRYGDELLLDLEVFYLKRNYSRWGIRHKLRRGDTICATITVEGSFIHSLQRKVIEPPALCSELMEKSPRASDFQWLD